MALVRRILLLSLVSVAGVGLLGPLAARSATPIPVIAEEHLLESVAQPPTSRAARGSLSDRGDAAAPPSAASEALTPSALPTPGAAPMEATLFSEGPPRVASAPQRVVIYDGDTVWDALAQCESGGNWAINTGNGYYGGLQFSHATWHGYGGGEFAEYPHQATREEQIAVAERLHAERGFAPWPSCRSKLGLP